MDLDYAKDVEVTAGGRRRKLGRLRVGMIEDFADWARPKVTAQIDAIRGLLGSLPPEAAAAKADEAVDLLRQIDNFSLESPLARALLGTSAGQLKFIHLRLLSCDPGATADDAWEVLQAVGAEAARRAAAAGKGADPNPPAPASAP